MGNYTTTPVKEQRIGVDGMLTGNFNMTTEDFPALPGALPPAAGVSNLLGGSGLLDTVSHQQQRENGATPCHE